MAIWELRYQNARARFPCRRSIRWCLKCGNRLAWVLVRAELFLRAYYACVLTSPRKFTAPCVSDIRQPAVQILSSLYVRSCSRNEKKRDEIREGRGERFLHRIETRLLVHHLSLNLSSWMTAKRLRYMPHQICYR